MRLLNYSLYIHRNTTRNNQPSLQAIKIWSDVDSPWWKHALLKYTVGASLSGLLIESTSPQAFSDCKFVLLTKCILWQEMLQFPRLFIYCFTAQVLKVCRTPGPIPCSATKMLKLCLKS